MGDIAIENALQTADPGDGNTLQIYLQKDALNLDSCEMDADPDEYDDQIFNLLPHRDLINTGTANNGQLNTPILSQRASAKSRKRNKKMAKFQQLMQQQQSPLQSPSPTTVRSNMNVVQEQLSMSPSPRMSAASMHSHHAQISQRRPCYLSGSALGAASDALSNSLSSLQNGSSSLTLSDWPLLKDMMSRNSTLADRQDGIWSQRMYAADDGGQEMSEKHQLMEEEMGDIDDDGEIPRDKQCILEVFPKANINEKIDDGAQSVMNTTIVLDPQSRSKQMMAANDPFKMETAGLDPSDYNPMSQLKGCDPLNPMMPTRDYFSASDTESEHFVASHFPLRKKSNQMDEKGAEEAKEQYTAAVHPFMTQWSEDAKFRAMNRRNKRFAQIYPQPHQVLYCAVS